MPAIHAPTSIPTNGTPTTNLKPQRPLPLRRPSHLGPLTPPPLEFLLGKWHITHSTLPTWRDKRDVTITYTLDTSNSVPRLDDTVSFNQGSKERAVRGSQAERDPQEKETASWNWRGKGIIKIASAHWEVLGWGGSGAGGVVDGAEANDGVDGIEGGGEDDWMVTFFVKTVFTPAGVNVYARQPGGTSPKRLESVREALRATGHADLVRLAGEIYEVERSEG